MKNLIMKYLLRIDNLLYKIISYYSIKLEGEHPKHKIMKYHTFFEENIKDNSTILDIGCGQGFLVRKLSKKAKKIVGIDLHKKNIEKAKKYKKENVEFIVGDATKYKFKEKFDYIVLSNVLEHIKNRKKFLNDIKKLSNKILIRVPMIDREWVVIYKKEKNVDYRLDPTHYIEYTEDIFREEMKEAGLNIESLKIKWGEIYAVIK